MNELKQFIVVYIILSILQPVLTFGATWTVFYGSMLAENNVFLGTPVFLLGCILGFMALFKAGTWCLLVLYLKKYQYTTNKYIYKIFTSIKLLLIMLPLTFIFDFVINLFLNWTEYNLGLYSLVTNCLYTMIYLNYTFSLYCLIACIVLYNNVKCWKKIKKTDSNKGHYE